MVEDDDADDGMAELDNVLVADSRNVPVDFVRLKRTYFLCNCDHASVALSTNPKNIKIRKPNLRTYFVPL